jgi:hypothetical protein
MHAHTLANRLPSIAPTVDPPELRPPCLPAPVVQVQLYNWVLTWRFTNGEMLEQESAHLHGLLGKCTAQEQCAAVHCIDFSC